MANLDSDESELYLNIFNVLIRVTLVTPDPGRFLLPCYSAFLAEPGEPGLSYGVGMTADGAFFVDEGDGTRTVTETPAGFIYHFEKAITLALEVVRKDLFFIHGAALGRDGEACLLVAPSGSGKSTTSWALLQHGFSYLSDELAPIDLSRLVVEPYPHALCLKARPPAPYDLPAATLDAGRTLHVPVEGLPRPFVTSPLPLRAVFYVHYDPQAQAPSLLRLSAGESAARLYANGLNQLAHDNKGLAAAAAIAQQVSSFDVTTASLKPTCQLIGDTLASLG